MNIKLKSNFLSTINHSTATTMQKSQPYLGIKSVQEDEAISAADAIDRIAAMKSQESSYRCEEYFQSTGCSTACNKMDIEHGAVDPATIAVSSFQCTSGQTASNLIDDSCRIKMCEWCYQVVDYFTFSRESVCISMSYVDRFLATEEGQPYLYSRSAYQLAAITALYIAIKIKEPLELDLELLVELGRDCYTASQISEMELIMLDALDWRVCPPTSIAFAQHIISLLPPHIDDMTRQSILTIARYQTELAVFNSSFIAIPQLTIAISAILNAMEGIDYTYFPRPSRAAFLKIISREVGSEKHDLSVLQSRRMLLAALWGTEKLEFSPRKMRNESHGDEKSQCQELRENSSAGGISPVCVSVSSRTV